MWWHEQTWPTIESLDKRTPVVIPIGSIEQHGRHLPVMTDTAQVTAIAERAEQALGPAALFLPTLWLGCSDHHKDFPGTISVRPSLYSEMIKSVARSVLDASFTRILFLNGHGGNETPAAQALTELAAEDDRADAAHIVFASWWQLGRDAITPDQHGLTTPAISHACEYETSLMLALHPNLIDPSATQSAPPSPPMPWHPYAGKIRAFHRFHRLTTTGSLGAPPQATAQKGQSILDALTTQVVAFLRDFATWPDTPPLNSTRKS